MDFFAEQSQALKQQLKKNQRSAEIMKRDWAKVFLDNDAGLQVLGDMLNLCDYFGEPPSTNRNDLYLWVGMRRFINLIVESSGLDNVDKLARLQQIAIVAWKNREGQDNFQADA